MKLKNRAARAADYQEEQTVPPETEERAEPYKVFATKEEYDRALAEAIADEESDREGDTKEADGGRAEEDRIIAEWRRGERELKELVPGFDLREAMEDKTFAEALTGGSSVAQAYLVMQSRKGTAAERREIAQNAQTADKGTGRSRVNPASLPTPEFNAYINRIIGN